MTDQDYAAWLAQPSAQRAVLLEIGVNSGGSETTRYLANYTYNTLSTDTPASTFYDARVVGPVSMTEQLGLGADASSMSIADIELINDDGGLDSWLNDVFTKRSISIYYGDPSWSKADFRVVYAGVIDSLEASSQQHLVLKMSDKMQRLDSAVTETKLGGTTPNADALIPLCFGECHNVTPLLTNPATLEYQVHNGPIESIIEVRDNEVPVNYTPVLASGKFTLAAAPVGTITCSVQGDKPVTYANDVGTLIQRLVLNYGRSDQRLVSGDLDTSNFTAFVTANPQPVGLYLTDSTQVIDACTTLAAAVGAKLVMSRAGLLRLVKIALPSTPTMTVDANTDALNDSLRISSRTPIAAACKLAYCKNWTVQEAVQSGVPAQHMEMFRQEWLTSTATDTTTANLYKLSTDVAQEESLLLKKTDADAEALRRLNLRKVQRAVYEFVGFAPQLQCELGQGISLSSPRFNMSAGVAGQVVSLNMDWLESKVTVGVLG